MAATVAWGGAASFRGWMTTYYSSCSLTSINEMHCHRKQTQVLWIVSDEGEEEDDRVETSKRSKG